MSIISHNQTIGILGGGQLGRMLAIEARKMGYKIIVLDPISNCPASQIADHHLQAQFNDLQSAKKMADKCDIITYEFENIDLNLVKELEKQINVFPSSSLLAKTQNRLIEKKSLQKIGIKVADFCKGNNFTEIKKIGFPGFIKINFGGYDGKGQWLIKNKKDLKKFQDASSFNKLISKTIYEKKINFIKEISVIATRGQNGEIAIFEVAENIHQDNILDITIVPARIPNQTQKKAQQIAQQIAQKYKIIGTFCVEMFLLADGEILVNEIAPRPHNSGHYTFCACATSQFEQQLRAICGLPFGSTKLFSPVIMKNILGSHQGNNLGGIDKLLQNKKVKLHLYGKSDSKEKRKMGHFIYFGEDVEEVKRLSEELYWY